ncbi:hypothetical protein ACFSM5_11210 [Lacibacterium aquatile]|uniref:Uncharacterized protein n=1 Tax=Lacibacterium aquatile TaxID=1168082 RepID=A0ABW5DQL5_9PROT
MKTIELPLRAYLVAHCVVRSGAFVTMLELEAAGDAFHLKRIASRPYTGAVHPLTPRGELVIVEALGGAGAVILHECRNDAGRARRDRLELMRKSHPGGGQVDAFISSGQKIALKAKQTTVALWPRSQKLGLGAALGLAFLLLDHLYVTGRLTADGLRQSLESIERLLEVGPVRRPSRMVAA